MAETHATDQQHSDQPTDAEPDPGLDATIQTDTLRAITSAVAAANDDYEAVIYPTADGLDVHVVGAANVRLVDAHIPASTFDAYDHAPGQFGLDTDTFTTMLSGDTAHLTWGGDARLHVTSGPVDAHLAGVDPEYIKTNRAIDEMLAPTSARVTVPADDLVTAFGIARKIDEDQVYVIADPADDWVGLASSADVDDVDIQFEHATVDEAPAGRIKTRFNGGYLKGMVQAVRGTDADLTIRIGDGCPMGIAYEHEGAEVQFLIAPRIDTR